jgi:DNA-binding NtrC family response regulator
VPEIAPDGPGGSASDFTGRGCGGAEKPVALVVDDDEQVRQLLAELLARAGCECVVASGSAEALVAARAAKPRLAVVDLMGPGAGGLEVASDLQGSHPGVVLAGLSAHPEAWDAADLDRLGIGRVFAKPFSVPRFLDWARAAVAELSKPGGPGRPPHPGDS